MALGDPSWRNYQEVGDDPDASLAIVREAALQIQSVFPSATVELVVLDSLDWMANVTAERFEGDFGHCNKNTVWVRLDSSTQASLYADEVPVDKLGETIRSHFAL